MISAATPNLIRSLSVTKKAFLKPRLAASTAMTLRHPAPKYEVSFKIMRFMVIYLFKGLTAAPSRVENATVSKVIKIND
jgi:hypothetical protein